MLLHLQADYITASAPFRTIGMADGSTVDLAPDRAISIAFSGGKRAVDLLTDEAVFTVRRDSDQPFRVLAGGVEVTDIGSGAGPSVHRLIPRILAIFGG